MYSALLYIVINVSTVDGLVSRSGVRTLKTCDGPVVGTNGTKVAGERALDCDILTRNRVRAHLTTRPSDRYHKCSLGSSSRTGFGRLASLR